MQKLSNNEHLSLFYETVDEQLRFLVDYFRAGFERNELCILATHSTEKEIAHQLESAGLDISGHIRAGDIHIFSALEAYLPQGRFVADYMIGNLAYFVQAAADQGYSGIRVASETHWPHDTSALQTETSLYENSVNELLKGNSHFTELCLYPAHTSPDEVIKGAVQTHPKFVYDNEIHNNPYYFSPDKFTRFNSDKLPKNTDRWLESLKKKRYRLKLNDTTSREMARTDQAIKKLLTA
ncbi:MAG: hypothetical protein JWO35_289 [Candidatus Saccharibacteria bacterium]|nr:hypothetical protein [Candidatus Saccharibacteria bacterium]